MSMLGKRLLLLFATLAAGLPAAHAQFAVVDIASVTQLISQVKTLEEQLATARAHLAQAQALYQSTTGGRGMERLLSGTVRNYLPSDWTGLQSAFQSAGGSYTSLSTDLSAAISANAVLSAQQLAGLSAGAKQQLQSARQSVALSQVVAHQALATTSNRFASLQQLVGAISQAGDQKAVLDLQARIAVEAGMLQNEQTKLQVLYQSAQAEEWANQERTRERVLSGHGQFSTRFQPAP
ncbi:MAG: conjugal transfer protein TrbF [Gammaproteobacteria bacterium]|nr:conjugal transfer protein TrbF [Gammaproteobacteria bacterium]